MISVRQDYKLIILSILSISFVLLTTWNEISNSKRYERLSRIAKEEALNKAKLNNTETLAVGISDSVSSTTAKVSTSSDTVVKRHERTPAVLKGNLQFEQINLPVSKGKLLGTDKLPKELYYIPSMIEVLGKGNTISKIKEVIVVPGNNQDTVASTKRIGDKFILTIYANKLNTLSPLEKKNTIIHELLHVTSMSVSDFHFDSCETIMTLVGCPTPNTLVYDYYKNFGNSNNTSNYINAYAYTHILEDFAETGAYAISGYTLTSTNTVLISKFEFFKNDPRLADLRANAQSFAVVE